MDTVGAYEAKTHLPALLNRVANGEQITITRHGVPVAVLVSPDQVPKTLPKEEAVRALMEFEKKYNKNNLSVANSIQTNGSLIDEEWAAFFAENDFLVGLSIDGGEEVHDLVRGDAAGNQTTGAA